MVSELTLYSGNARIYFIQQSVHRVVFVIYLLMGGIIPEWLSHHK